MNKYKGILLALLAVGLMSCSSDDIAGVSSSDASGAGQDTPITFVPSSTVVSKAYTDGSVNTEEEMRTGSFGVLGYFKNQQSYRMNDNTGTAIEHVYKTVGTGASAVNKWYYNDETDIEYWTARTMNFYAYFPYTMTAAYADSDASGDVMTLTGWTKGQDVMYARSLNHTNEVTTPLEFQHAFTKIDSISFKVAEGYPYRFEIDSVEITNTHCETDGKVILSNTGDPTYADGAAKITCGKKFTSPVVVDTTAAHINGEPLVVKADKMFLFPLTKTDTIWDGTTQATDICINKLTVHLRARVYQGTECIVSGKDDTPADLYFPVKGTTNQSQTFDRDKAYTINYTISNGTGYDKDGGVSVPIALTVAVDSWNETTVGVHQITVNKPSVTIAKGSTDATVTVSADEIGKLKLTCSTGLTASVGKSGTKIVLTITNESLASGTGTVEIYDNSSNSSTTITVKTS